MKRIPLIAAAVLCSALSLSAQANERLDFCKTMSETAGKIAQGRYNGVPMANVMAAVQQVSVQSMRQYGQLLVEYAYDLPDFSTKPYQQRAIVDFQNTVFSTCFQGHEQ